MAQIRSNLGSPTSGHVHCPRKRFPLDPRPSEAKKTQNGKTSKHLPPITNGSNMGPITTDFDETRWDLIPPMRPRSSGGSRVKKPNFDLCFFPSEGSGGAARPLREGPGRRLPGIPSHLVSSKFIVTNQIGFLLFFCFRGPAGRARPVPCPEGHRPDGPNEYRNGPRARTLGPGGPPALGG